MGRSITMAPIAMVLLLGTGMPGQRAVRERFAGPTKEAPPRSPRALARIVYPADRIPLAILPDGSRRSIHSLLKVPNALHHGEFVWDDAGVPSGSVWIRVELSRQLLSVFRAGHEIGTAVILYGAASKPTPAGVYPILERAERHRSSLYQAQMPYMLRLTVDGVAIHASDVRPQGATHGCIGVPLPFARRLFGQMRKGDIVAVI